ncbi:MAG TPA: hypothetical protein VF173_04015 [Thermoanaerobaculia bacterium]|nr:hypothetical protein [Thermoanaerobaculia bacterium]
MSSLLKEVGREFKGIFTVALYLVNFIVIGAIIAWLSGVFGKCCDAWGLEGLEGLREGLLHHAVAGFCTVVVLFSVERWWSQRQQRELKALVRIIYETFYGAIRLEHKTIYRVSCYRYRTSSFRRGLRRYFHWNKKMWSRRPLKGSPYLECIERYGHDGGRRKRTPTTLTMTVSPKHAWSEGFAGLVAREEQPLVAQTANVNAAVSKVKVKAGVKLSDERKKLWADVQKGGQGSEEEVAWKAVSEAYDLDNLSDDEKGELESFVKATNTTPYLLSGVRGGNRHCNNFFGFPVFREHELWGVVTIDALDDEFNTKMADRLKALGVPSVSDWINVQLDVFAAVFEDVVQL